MYAFGIGPFAPAPSPTPIATPSLLPTGSPLATPSPTIAFTPSPTPTAPATASPSPTAAPTETPTVAPTETATVEPTPSEVPTETASAAPTPSPTSPIPPSSVPSGVDPTQVLLGHIPEEFRDTCTVNPGIAPQLAISACSADNGELLMTYTLFATREDMQAAYDLLMAAALIEPDTGTCSDETTWPTENGYTIGGVDTGRYLCVVAGFPTIHWTDDRFNILAQVSHALSNYDRLLDFWANEAGPI
jgi:hypothetical protein